MSKKFVYLAVGVRDNHPPYEQFVNNDSDCIVCYWDKPPPKNTPWRSLYLPNPSTWTQCRNLLMAEAYNQDEYEYFICIDDDITLSHPFAEFEKFVSEQHPAIGYCDYKWHGKPNQEQVQAGRSGRIPITSWLCFDPCLNAFHRDVLPCIYPLCTEHDNTSWWWSGEMLYFHIWSQYRGQIKQANHLFVTNHRSEPYPRGEVQMIAQAHRVMMETVLPHRRNHFESIVFPRGRSLHDPVSTSPDFKRTSEQLALDFDLSHSYWQNIRRYWEKVRGYWI